MLDEVGSDFLLDLPLLSFWKRPAKDVVLVECQELELLLDILKLPNISLSRFEQFRHVLGLLRSGLRPHIES